MKQQNCSLAGLGGGKSGILPFFALFCHLGVDSQPLHSRQYIHHLNLTPTPLGINLKTTLITWKFFVSFFFVDSWCIINPWTHLARCHPLGSAPATTPYSKQFFTSNQYIWSGFYHSMHCKIEFTAEYHPTFSKGNNDKFWPFLLSLPGFCLRSSTVQMSGVRKLRFIDYWKSWLLYTFPFFNN